MYIQGKKDTEQQEKDIKDISIFRDSKSCLFIYKKTNKLSAGIYMVTNLLSDNEPLKWELRNCAQKLVSCSTDDIAHLTFSQSKTFPLLRVHTLTILSLLDIAFYGGLVSEMNHLILKGEFTAFLFSLEEILTKECAIGMKNIDPHFFELPKEYRFFTSGLRQEKGQKTSPNSSSFTKRHTIRHSQDMSFMDNELGHLEMKNDEIYKGQKESKEARKEAILVLLKNKDSLTIKDFSSTIKDCSEKTIQRELLGMVASGILKKEGERRWSRYSLVVS